MFELDSSAIRSLLIERRMTIRELAQRADITETTAARLTREGSKSNAKTLGKVATALGVGGNELILSSKAGD